MNGLTVYTKSGQALALFETGKSGGEGKIYTIKGNPFNCAKIYYEKVITQELHDKIVAMTKNVPDDPTWSVIGYRSIAWPIEVVFFDSDAKRFAGYTMPYIDKKVFRESHLYYDPADRIREFGGTFTWKYLLTTAYNICSAVYAVHQKGHCVGDLRENNILVSPNALISLVDCDSFQIRDKETSRVFYTRVGTGEFLPPELHSINFKERDIDRLYADRFALAIIVFKFLMMGVHPYQSKGKEVEDTPSTEAKLLKGLFPYEKDCPVKPPDYAPDYEIIPDKLKVLFKKCFVDGHKDPFERPTARQWLDAIAEELGQLKDCKVNKNHIYSGHLKSCPWCRLSFDYFPQSLHQGPQVILPQPGSTQFESVVLWCPNCGVAMEYDFNNCPNCAMPLSEMG